jgi:hypothetical protein
MGMKVTPNLFPPNATPPRQNGEASEARRAFEAMLNASAAQTRSSQKASPLQEAAVMTSVQVSPRPTKGEDTVPLIRPGRVLDISV